MKNENEVSSIRIETVSPIRWYDRDKDEEFETFEFEAISARIIPDRDVAKVVIPGGILLFGLDQLTPGTLARIEKVSA
jgi:hypothetical protein